MGSDSQIPEQQEATSELDRDILDNDGVIREREIEDTDSGGVSQRISFDGDPHEEDQG